MDSLVHWPTFESRRRGRGPRISKPVPGFRGRPSCPGSPAHPRVRRANWLYRLPGTARGRPGRASQAEFPEAVEAVASGGAAGCSEAEGPASGTPLTAPVLSFPGLSRVPGREGTHTGFSFLCWKLALHFSCLLRQHGLCPHLCVLSPRRVNWGKSAWTVLTVKT